MTKKHTCHLALALAAALAPAALRADTFRIEIDYMVTGTHSHQPSAAVIAAVQQMFACQGHTLIVDVDDALTHYNVLRRNPNNCSASLFSYSGSNDSYGKIKADNFDNGAGWHYCIFAHQYEDSNCNTTSSSGLANSTVDFIVTLGAFTGQTGTEYAQAATLAHEFGHNLGLSHCGTMNCGSNTGAADYVGPYVPNLPSVMSYRYQLEGVRTNMLCHGLIFPETLFKDIDYSHGRMCSLNEDNLNENTGTTMIRTDWDCNGSFSSSVAQDINGDGDGWCGSTGNRTTLNDYNEWANIRDLAGKPARLAQEPVVEYTCITYEEWVEVQIEKQMLAADHCANPTLATEPCSSGNMVYVGSNPFIINSGTCILPYESLSEAQTASPAGSVYILKPGTIDEAGSVLLNKRGFYFCKIGSALVR